MAGGSISETLKAKYKVRKDGWGPQRPNPRQSSLWRGFLSVQSVFESMARYQVGSVEQIRFWIDTWVDQTPWLVTTSLEFLQGLVLAFAWLAIYGAILTIDDVHKQNIIIVNGCPMCVAECIISRSLAS